MWGWGCPCYSFQKTALLEHSQQNSLRSLLGVNKDFIILGKWEGVLFKVEFHWLRLQVLWIPHFHG